MIFRAIRSRATAEKSSKLWMCCSFTAPLCHEGPNSPPPRMFATTYTPPRASQAAPRAPL